MRAARPRATACSRHAACSACGPSVRHCTSLSAGKVNSNGCAAAGLAVSLERVRGLRDRVRGDDATGGDCCGRRAAASCGDSLQPAGLGVS